MSDWEDYSIDRPTSVIPASVPSIPIPSSKWDDDDDSDSSVADDWDASDNENVLVDENDVKPSTCHINSSSSTPSALADASTSASNANQSSPAKPKKRSIKLAIAERQAQEDSRLRELAEKRAASAIVDQLHAEESPNSRRARLQRQVEDEDAKHVEDLFCGSNTIIVPAIDGKPNPDRNLLTLTPRTNVDFDDYLTMVLARFADFDKRPLYPLFVCQLARKLCEQMSNLEDIRKVASSLNALANDRQRQDKEAQKKGKKPNTKKQVRVEAEDLDDLVAGAYYEGDFDGDDFM